MSYQYVCFAKVLLVKDTFVIGQRVMGQVAQRLGKLLMGLPEDLLFHGFFGVSAEVAVEAWQMMEGHNSLPPNPEFLHYLCAFTFMKTYPAIDKALSRSSGGVTQRQFTSTCDHLLIWFLHWMKLSRELDR
jgi:hypothetical protein